MKKAFTLIELLIIVIVLGILAEVALPRFTRMLETHKTGEAEELFSAVRTEQEKRCVMGKNYWVAGQENNLASLSNGSQHYKYHLLPKGVEAVRPGKQYTLKMWYKTGEMCCQGEGCKELTKDYSPCVEPDDECVGKVCEEKCEGNFYLDKEDCKCKCKLTQEDCEENWKLNDDACVCECSLTDADCPEGYKADTNKCQCVEKDNCEDDEYFEKNKIQCCKDGSDREECFEYKWVSSTQVGDRCGTLICLPGMIPCTPYTVPADCRYGKCSHVSGERLLKHDGDYVRTACDGFAAWLSSFMPDSVQSLTYFTGEERDCSALENYPCNKENLGKSSTYFCEGGVVNTDSIVIDPPGIWLYVQSDFYNATITQTCKREPRWKK